MDPFEVGRVRPRLPEDLVPRLEVVPRAGSTNSEMARSAADWPDFGVLLAEHQEAGRGRAGREWTTPPGTSLTVSVMLRPPVPQERWAWAGLLGALAVVRAVGAFGLLAWAKWPNDVVVDSHAAHVDGWGSLRKVAGVLAEVVPGGIVLGIGVNVLQRTEELPVPWASSLASLGAQVPERPREELVVHLVRQLWQLDERWRAHDGDAAEAGLLEEYAAACRTLGRPVAVTLPGGEVLAGTAEGLATDGALVVRTAEGQRELVRAGDVQHLRVPGV